MEWRDDGGHNELDAVSSDFGLMSLKTGSGRRVLYAAAMGPVHLDAARAMLWSPYSLDRASNTSDASSCAVLR